MSEIKLLPCPFCGGEAFIHTVEPHKHVFATFMPDYDGSSFIECTRCTCALSGATEEEVTKAWNTRKPIERIVERLEEEKGKSIYDSSATINVKDAWQKAIRIVRAGGKE